MAPDGWCDFCTPLPTPSTPRSIAWAGFEGVCLSCDQVFTREEA